MATSRMTCSTKYNCCLNISSYIFINLHWRNYELHDIIEIFANQAFFPSDIIMMAIKIIKSITDYLWKVSISKLRSSTLQVNNGIKGQFVILIWSCSCILCAVGLIDDDILFYWTIYLTVHIKNGQLNGQVFEWHNFLNGEF